MIRYVLGISLVLAACTSSSPATTSPLDVDPTVATTVPAPTSAPTTTAATDRTTTTTTPATTAPSITAPSVSTTSSTTPSTAIPDPNNTAPTVSLDGPIAGSQHRADYDPTVEWFVAQVELVAAAGDIDGDELTIEWFSDVGGFLGSGAVLSVGLQPLSDVTPTTLTVRVTDANGAVTEASVTVVVWIPSPT